MSKRTTVKKTASSLFTLVKVAARRTPGLRDGQTLPRIERTVRVVPDAAWLRSYRGLVGAVDDGLLPPCVPQVLASPLHAQLLSDPKFVLPAVGMVHIRSSIVEHRVVRDDEVLDITVSIEGHTPHERGVTFDMVTRTLVAGVEVQRGAITLLVRSRGQTSHKAPETQQKQPERTPTPSSTSALSSSVIAARADIGRRYGVVSGDVNPIHLSTWSAKAFGFPRAIAHGMWVLGRALVEVSDHLPNTPRTTEVRFIKPMLLPSSAVVQATRDDDAMPGTLAIAVRPARGGPGAAPHALLTVRPHEQALKT
jgi:acyl dehydratase